MPPPLGGGAFTFELLEQCPDWSEVENDPPLPARSALEAAKRYLPKLISNPEAWSSQEIRLVPIREKKWVYVIHFSERRLGLNSPFVIVVLMNGEPIEPKITRQ
jgi:hypothetical protein